MAQQLRVPHGRSHRRCKYFQLGSRPPQVVGEPTPTEVHDALFNADLVESPNLALVRILGPGPDRPGDFDLGDIDEAGLFQPALHTRRGIEVQAGLEPGLDEQGAPLVVDVVLAQCVVVGCQFDLGIALLKPAPRLQGAVKQAE